MRESGLRNRIVQAAPKQEDDAEGKDDDDDDDDYNEVPRARPRPRQGTMMMPGPRMANPPDPADGACLRYS